MPKPINAQKKNPQRYEIVEPLSYVAFPLSPEQKVGAEPRATSPGIERRYREAWDDTGKKIPAVPEQEIANFIPREPRRLCLEKNAPFGSYTAWVSKFLLKRWTGFLAEFSTS